MKSKLTLLCALLLVATFSFGQNEMTKNRQESPELLVKKHVKDSDSVKKKNSLAWKLQFEKRNTQKATSSNSRVVKQALDSLVSEEFDEFSNQWYYSDKQTFAYNFDGKITEDVYFYYNGTQWEGDSKTEYSYAANGTMTEGISYQWLSSQWKPSYKISYSYNSGNTVTTEIESYWDGTQWVDGFKTEYTYDGNWKIIDETSSYWDGSQWEPSFKTEYTYDMYGNVILETGSNWNGSQWETWNKYEYTYDSNGNLTESLDYFWDGNQWILGYKGEFTYDANGNMTQEIDSYWDGMQWVPEYKYDVTFDANGNLTQELGWYWEGGQWVEEYKNELNFNNMYSFNDLVLPYYFTEDGDNNYFNHMVTSVEELEKDSASGNWYSYYKASLYYSALNVNSVSDIEREHISVYPNPVSNLINVQFSEEHITANFELYDLQGRLIMSKNVASREQIDLERLISGMYFYNLVVGDETYTGKLIKE